MRRSIATVCVSGTLPDKLKAIACAGFDGLEIFENDLLYFTGRPRDGFGFGVVDRDLPAIPRL